MAVTVAPGTIAPAESVMVPTKIPPGQEPQGRLSLVLEIIHDECSFF
jgi:hypothetical protein